MEDKHLVVVHYSEIALKGQNRVIFEKALLNNILKKINGIPYEKIEKKATRFFIRLKEKDNADLVCEKLIKVFGVKWFSPAISVEKEINKIENEVKKIAEQYKNKKIKIETKRVDKKFPLTSLEISKRVAKTLEKNGFYTELKNPDVKIIIEILEDEAIIAYKKIEGEGGLPVGTTGKVLCLFSGGIDSPVAAWLMMRRGCHVDLLHIHTMPNDEKIKDSKINKIRNVLEEYSNEKILLYLAPYDEFYATSSVFPQKEEAVMFRRFIVMLANKIADREGYLGLVMGDNLAQVASQTLNNIAVVDEVSKIPIYRPLLTMSKEEIIKLAQKIGTYELSIEKYKDCCSLIAHKHPTTRANKKRIEKAEKKARMEVIVEKTLEKLSKI
ncbi:MAG: tRNA uracil 4-sulfurtransferase ThiI [Candidatus Bilamarchaeaceae archaeon]